MTAAVAVKFLTMTPVRRALIAGVLSAVGSTLYSKTSVEVPEDAVTVWFFANRFLFFGPFSLPIAVVFAAALWWSIGGDRRVSVPGGAWLTACSLGTWYMATRLTVTVVGLLEQAGNLPDIVKRIVFGMPGGAFGALCIVGSAAVLVRPLRSAVPVLGVTATGAVAGSAAGLTGDPGLGMLPLFLAWQTGVLVALALFAARCSSEAARPA